MTKTYRIQQFAKLAGVTVRTLHFYDQKGLLKPETRTESGYRVYQQSDLIRLQQILTLKALGFSLEMIGELLTDQAYTLQKALQLQKDALAQRIGQLQIAHYSLAQMLDGLDKAGNVDWEQVMTIIQSFAELSQADLVNRYYTPEQQAWIQDRAVYAPPALITEGARAWREVTRDFEQRRHLPPEHPEIQAIIVRMEELVAQFTGGDPAISEAHERHYRETEHRMPDAFRMTTDPELGAFIGEAVRVYQKNRRKHS
jgi:DNA-binding transcriptional MerR regulator